MINEIRFVSILDTDKIVKEKVRQWRNRQEIRKWMLSQGIISSEEHQRWLEGLSKRSDSKFWVVYFKNIPIGAAYLQHINVENRTTEWGFYIGEDDCRSRGFGKAILFNLLEEVFDKMSFQTLLTKVLADNAVAIKLYKRFHFDEKQRYFSKDAREVILFELKDSIWSKVKNNLRTMSFSQTS